MGVFENIREDIKRFIPETGFNVVGVDTFEPIGESLYLVAHVETREQAESIAAQMRRDHEMDRFHVYESESVFKTDALVD